MRSCVRNGCSAENGQPIQNEVNVSNSRPLFGVEVNVLRIVKGLFRMCLEGSGTSDQ